MMLSIFWCTYLPSVYLFRRNVYSFAHFSVGLYFGCWVVLLYSGYETLNRYLISKYLPLFCRMPFHSVVYFAVQRLYFSWSLFFSFAILLVSYPRNHCQIQCYKDFSLCYFPIFILGKPKGKAEESVVNGISWMKTWTKPHHSGGEKINIQTEEGREFYCHFKL